MPLPEHTKNQREKEKQTHLASKFNLPYFENNSQALTKCLYSIKQHSHLLNWVSYLRNAPPGIKRGGQDGP